MSGIATTHDETPFFFRASGADVFGIVTAPTGDANGAAAVVLSGGAFIGATNRNRVSVRIARRAAALGYTGVRIDYHGVGESSGTIDDYELDRPFVDDLLGAVRFLEDQGIRDFALVGSTCFGSRTALAAAEHIPGLRGLLLFATPIRDFVFTRDPDATPASHYLKLAFTPRAIRGLFTAKSRRQYAQIARTKVRTGTRRLLHTGAPAAAAAQPAAEAVSPGFLKPLEKLAKRGTPVLLAYGLEDDFYREFAAKRGGPVLSRVLEAPGSRIDVRTLPGTIHALPRLRAQEAVIAVTEEWLAALNAVPAAAT